MFIPDMLNVPPQNVPVMIAQTNLAQTEKIMMRTLGVCHPVPNMSDSNPTADNVIEPVEEAKTYFRLYEYKTVTDHATITVNQMPKHGDLSDGGNGIYAYLPEYNYIGNDAAIVLVDFGSVKVKVEYFFQIIEGPLGNTGLEDLCSATGIFWKISSSNLEDKGNNFIALKIADFPLAP